MKKFWAQMSYSWLFLLNVGIGIAATIIILFYKLGSLVPGLAPAERAYVASASDFHQLIRNPVYLPHKLPLYGLIQLTHQGAFITRSISALFGLAAVVTFYWCLRQLFTARVALLGDIMLLVSGWFLHTARLALPDILYPALVCMLMGLGIWLRQTSRLWLPALAAVVILASCLYMPGMLYLLIVLGIWQRKLVASTVRSLPWWMLGLCVVGTVILIAPLVWAGVHDMAVGRQALGIPVAFAPIDYARNFVYVFAALAVRSVIDPLRHLGRLPLLDVFGISMLILGAYWLYAQRKVLHTQLLVIAAGVSVLLISIGMFPQAALIPYIYLTIACGVALMLQQWFNVFPRNPLARSLGVTLIVLAIGLSSFYNLASYFVAWPGNPVTKTTFSSAKL